MRKLPAKWFPRAVVILLVGWTALIYFWLGPWADAGYGDPGEEHVTPGAALWLAGIAGIFWLLWNVFDLPPSEPGPDEDPNIG